MRPTLAACVVCLLCAPAVADDPKGPTLDKLDYRKFIDQHQKLIAEGKSKEAVEHLAGNSLTPEPTKGQAGEELQRKFAIVFGNGGKAVSHELAGYRRITSRAVRFYAVTHFDRAAVTYSYLFFRDADGAWKLSGFTLTEGVDELEKIVPFVPLRVAD